MSVSVVDAEEDVTVPGGAAPQESLPTDEDVTAERCIVCWRPPGAVVSRNSDSFTFGVNHVFERLSGLLQQHGVPPDEADAIVRKLRASDVELP